MILLRDSLDIYEKCWVQPESLGYDHQREALERFRHLIEDGSSCLLRSHQPGHMTGSILIATEDYSKILLTHHRKLGMWLQLGGHADGEEKLFEVALREGDEESGLKDLELTPVASLMGHPSPMPVPYDLDVHRIPARATEPEHFHYDTRYLATTSSPEAIQISDESNDLRWFTLEEAYTVTDEPAMIRQFDKLKWMRENVL